MILETHDLTKRYGSHFALHNVNLQISDRSIYGLVGPNGAGKTTLLSIIAGLRKQTSGNISQTIQRKEIAVCPDVPEFERWLTAYEVLELSANLMGVAKTKIEIENYLADAGLAESKDRKVGEFSRGMTQRLALASTIIGNPKLVILDEPCSALDPSGRAEVLDTISRMKDHTTVIFSTHILADVQRVCNYIGVLNKGELLHQGDLNSFLNENTNPIWNITLNDSIEQFMEKLNQAHWVIKAEALSQNKVQITGTSSDEVEINLIHLLSNLNLHIISIEPIDSDLEHAFLNLTQKETTQIK